MSNTLILFRHNRLNANHQLQKYCLVFFLVDSVTKSNKCRAVQAAVNQAAAVKTKQEDPHSVT